MRYCFSFNCAAKKAWGLCSRIMNWGCTGCDSSYIVRGAKGRQRVIDWEKVAKDPRKEKTFTEKEV